MQSPRWIILAGMAAVWICCNPAIGRAQEPVPPPPQAPQPTPESSSKQTKQKYSHANDFLIRGTVFTEQALAFPGVQVRIRRASEKKFRWETYTDSRGEFAVRVPQGTAYEMLIHVKGFADQTRTVDATAGDYEGNIVFRMMPGKGDKK